MDKAVSGILVTSLMFQMCLPIVYAQNIDIEKEYSLAVNCDFINNLSERLLKNSIWTFLYNQSKYKIIKYS